MDSLFDVSVPNEELQAPAFELLPAAAYATTLQVGTQLVQNDTGWKGIRLPFAGFRNTKTGQEFAGRQLNAQYTYEHANSQAVEIGTRGIIEAASAFGLTQTVDVDGKPSQKLTASSMEELVTQFNQVAGSEVEVYVALKERKRAGQVVRKEDGTSVMDNEVKRVSALKR